MAAARALSFAPAVMVRSGYGQQETERRRGRPRVNRELVIELKVRIEPAEFFVQKGQPEVQSNSAQNGNSHLHKNQNGSVQKSASLLLFQ